MRLNTPRWNRIASLILGFTLLGGGTASAAEVTCSVTVAKIKVMNSSNQVRVYSDTGLYWGLCILGTDPECQALVSMALAAQLSGKPMVLRLNDAETACNGNASPADIIEVNIANP